MSGFIIKQSATMMQLQRSYNLSASIEGTTTPFRVRIRDQKRIIQ